MLQAVALAQGPAATVPAAAPRRVVSMAPNLTEIVYDIGAQDLLVGVTDFCRYPPAARSKPRIGGWINPNYERILSLRPDLVLALGFHGSAVATLRKLKVKVLVLNCQTVEDVLDAYGVLGKALGRGGAARKAEDRLARRLEKVRRKPSDGPPLSVLFVVDRAPGALDQIYGVGPRNFVDSLIRWTGGKNILSDSPVPYPLVSKEQILKRDPDVILESLSPGPGGKASAAREVAVWNRMPSLKAVREHHVYCFRQQDFLIPGPSMVKLGEYLSRVFSQVRKDRR